MVGWAPNDWVYARYYVRADSEFFLELRERIAMRLISAFLLLTVSSFLVVTTAVIGSSWLASIFLTGGVAGSLYALLPGYLVVDGAKRELRTRTRLHKILPRPRIIPFHRVEEVAIWEPYDSAYRDRPVTLRMGIRDAAAIKIESTLDYEYANYLAHTLSERIGVKAVVRHGLWE
ncbi:MAG: hypothetical protein BMS9Abin01_2477 [Gammaproteobacteria bacterium]|nr:MAG: hypothetical protein BMS9Abin01_2477 [Gammaproteobacteria bacterium]